VLPFSQGQLTACNQGGRSGYQIPGGKSRSAARRCTQGNGKNPAEQLHDNQLNCRETVTIVTVPLDGRHIGRLLGRNTYLARSVHPECSLGDVNACHFRPPLNIFKPLLISSWVAPPSNVRFSPIPLEKRGRPPPCDARGREADEGG